MSAVETVARAIHECLAPDWMDHWHDLEDYEKRESQAWEIADIILADPAACRAIAAEVVERDRAQLLQEPCGMNELVPDRWWITTDFFERGGERVMGPFASQELAIEVRTLREQVEGHCRYFVDSEGGSHE